VSYLVDALRKAEQERHLGKVPSLAYETGETGSGKGRSSGVTWFVAGLLTVNVVLLALLWRGELFGERAVGPAPHAGKDGGSASSRVDQPSVSSRPAAADTSAKPGSTPGASEAPAISGHALRSRDAAGRAESAPLNSSTANTSSYAAGGQRASSSPTTESTSTSAGGTQMSGAGSASAATQPEPAVDEVPRLSALSQRERGGIPDLEINGHLYSSVPGRSFVLIGGRRYHEGERLAAGPAIESIDAKGAILRHGGVRFRLLAPR